MTIPTLDKTVTLEDLLQQYQAAAAHVTRQSRGYRPAFLELTKVVHSDKRCLSPDDVATFRAKTGLTNSYRYSVHRRIGAQYDRFTKHADKLPVSAESLYYLSHLTDAAFDAAVTSGAITADMTPKQCRNLRDPQRYKPRKDYHITVDLITQSFDAIAAYDFVQELSDWLHKASRRYACVSPELVVSADLQAGLRTVQKDVA